MTERRYNEEEVRLIFERAAEAQQAVRRQLPAGEGADGVSLADLRAIGREVGIPDELVDQAARSLERPGHPTTRTFLGLPLGVGRTIDLGRKLSDEEWDRLVVDLRETFDARGRVHKEGGLKQWTNGNLQALLEPVPGGDRLRLKTTKGNSRAMMGFGAMMVSVSVAMMVTAALGGSLAEAVQGFGVLLATGAGMFGVGAAQLPMWARERRRQMEAVAARLALAGESTDSAKALPKGEE